MINKLLNKNHLIIILVFFLLSIFFIQATTSVLKRSNTWDESGHLLSGYAYVKSRIDYLEPSHPVLGRLIPALPLLFFDLRFEPGKVNAQNAPGSDFYPYSLKFLFENNTDGKKLFFYSRVFMIALGIILGIHIFIWAKMLYGNKGGLLALFFYALCPNILAHSGLVTTDFPLTVFFFISLFYLYLLTDKITILRAVLAGISLGLALTAKYSALLLSLPYMAAFLYIFLKKDINISNGLSIYKKNILIPAVFVLILLTSYLTIWSVYGFDYRSDILAAKPENEIGRTVFIWEGNKTQSAMLNTILDGSRRFHLLPESYIYGLYRFLSRADEGHAAFLMGEYSGHGWWYYFLMAFLIKTPIPVLYLFLGSLLFLVRYKNKASTVIFLILPVILLFFVSTRQHINIGLRHILPIYPLIYVLIGSLTNINISRKRLASIILALAMIWSVWTSINIYPYYLAYFNEFIGGPKNGYKYLVDSNLDWGQDLPGLKEYMDSNSIKKIKLSYFGFSDPAYYDINYEYLPSYSIPNPNIKNYNVPLEGYFAISATMLQGVYLPDRDYYKLFREIEPVGMIGYSIFIYKFDEAKK
ncbi:MAG: glycosyltransferase family 39 protein [Deltaproteobacteria bacterium]|nr:glycosyltransferase family 39 protein [Deltaproteobacteria bacterium]